MTDQDILTAGVVTTTMAARYLGMSVNQLRDRLDRHLPPLCFIGDSVEYKTGRHAYHIYPERLVKFKHGEDLDGVKIITGKIEQIECLLSDIQDAVEELI